MTLARYYIGYIIAPLIGFLIGQGVVFYIHDPGYTTRWALSLATGCGLIIGLAVYLRRAGQNRVP